MACVGSLNGTCSLPTPRGLGDRRHHHCLARAGTVCGVWVDLDLTLLPIRWPRRPYFATTCRLRNLGVVPLVPSCTPRNA